MRPAQTNASFEQNHNLHLYELLVGSSIETETQLVSSALQKNGKVEKYIEDIQFILNEHRLKTFQNTMVIIENIISQENIQQNYQHFRNIIEENLTKFRQIQLLHQMKNVLNNKIIQKIDLLNSMQQENREKILIELGLLNDSLEKVELALSQIESTWDSRVVRQDFQVLNDLQSGQFQTQRIMNEPNDEFEFKTNKYVEKQKDEDADDESEESNIYANEDVNNSDIKQQRTLKTTESEFALDPILSKNYPSFNENDEISSKQFTVQQNKLNPGNSLNLGNTDQSNNDTAFDNENILNNLRSKINKEIQNAQNQHITNKLIQDSSIVDQGQNSIKQPILIEFKDQNIQDETKQQIIEVNESLNEFILDENEIIDHFSKFNKNNIEVEENQNQQRNQQDESIKFNGFNISHVQDNEQSKIDDNSFFSVRESHYDPLTLTNYATEKDSQKRQDNKDKKNNEKYVSQFGLNQKTDDLQTNFLEKKFGSDHFEIDNLSYEKELEDKIAALKNKLFDQNDNLLDQHLFKRQIKNDINKTTFSNTQDIQQNNNDIQKDKVIQQQPSSSNNNKINCESISQLKDTLDTNLNKEKITEQNKENTKEINNQNNKDHQTKKVENNSTNQDNLLNQQPTLKENEPPNPFSLSIPNYAGEYENLVNQFLNQPKTKTKSLSSQASQQQKSSVFDQLNQYLESQQQQTQNLGNTFGINIEELSINNSKKSSQILNENSQKPEYDDKEKQKIVKQKKQNDKIQLNEKRNNNQNNQKEFVAITKKENQTNVEEEEKQFQKYSNEKKILHKNKQQNEQVKNIKMENKQSNNLINKNDNDESLEKEETPSFQNRASNKIKRKDPQNFMQEMENNDQNDQNIEDDDEQNIVQNIRKQKNNSIPQKIKKNQITKTKNDNKEDESDNKNQFNQREKLKQKLTNNYLESEQNQENIEESTKNKIKEDEDEEENPQILEEPIETLMDDYPLLFKNTQLQQVITQQKKQSSTNQKIPQKQPKSTTKQQNINQNQKGQVSQVPQQITQIENKSKNSSIITKSQIPPTKKIPNKQQIPQSNGMLPPPLPYNQNVQGQVRRLSMSNSSQLLNNENQQNVEKENQKSSINSQLKPNKPKDSSQPQNLKNNQKNINPNLLTSNEKPKVRSSSLKQQNIEQPIQSQKQQIQIKDIIKNQSHYEDDKEQQSISSNQISQNSSNIKNKTLTPTPMIGKKLSSSSIITPKKYQDK